MIIIRKCTLQLQFIEYFWHAILPHSVLQIYYKHVLFLLIEWWVSNLRIDILSLQAMRLKCIWTFPFSLRTLASNSFRIFNLQQIALQYSFLLVIVPDAITLVICIFIFDIPLGNGLCVIELIITLYIFFRILTINFIPLKSSIVLLSTLKYILLGQIILIKSWLFVILGGWFNNLF